MKNYIFLTIAALTLTASAQVDVAFPYSDTADHIFERHSAAWDTPVAQPPNWFHNRNSRAKAQEAMRDFYDYDSRRTVQPIKFVNSKTESGVNSVRPTTFIGREAPQL